MGTMKHTILLALVVPAALALAGCKTSPIRFDALAPASQADLDTLKADTDKDRENLKGAVDTLGSAVAAVRDDLAAAQIAVTNTNAALNGVKQAQGEIDAHLGKVENRPTSGGIPGALVSAIAGSGVLPPWLDWAVTLLGTALGINTTRNASRRKALAKVAADKAKATPPAPAS